ncbi:hypothetical protein JCM15765_02770 [Paradesulfitobacterium aromaticivorans]
MAQELLLKEKCKDMMRYGYQALKDIPKDYRYTLGADLRTSMTNLLQLIIRASKRYYKKTTLEDMDIELDTIRILIRVAFENHAVTIKEYENWSILLDELGRMIGGWLRSVKQGQG